MMSRHDSFLPPKMKHSRFFDFFPRNKENPTLQEDQIDRLSQLPDSVIQHILSLIDTKSAVQTCILSKRWTHIWRYVHTLNLFSYSFNSLCDFRRFIVYALRHCKTSTSVLAVHMELSLSVGMCYLDESLLDGIMNSFVSCGVKDIDLSIRGNDDYSFLPSLLATLHTCPILRNLKLHIHRKTFVDYPNSLSLSSLKTLHLCRLKISNKNHCSDLFSTCVNLEDLVLDQLDVKILNIFTISAPCLSNLTISYLTFNTHENRSRRLHWTDKGWNVVIDAPRLTNFKLESGEPLLLSINNSPLLDKVNVNVPHYVFKTKGKSEELFLLLTKMLREFSNARSLTVSSDIIKTLSKFPSSLEDQPSAFCNLQSLKVKGYKTNFALPVMKFFDLSARQLKFTDN